MSVANAEATSADEPRGTNRPSVSFEIISGIPPTFEAKTGTPNDIASIIDIAETKNLQTELNQFLENNYHGEMDWLENKKDFRSDPKKLWVKKKQKKIA